MAKIIVQGDRLLKLNQIAIHQMQILEDNPGGHTLFDGSELSKLPE